MKRFKVIKFRRKNDTWKFAVIRKRFWRADEVIVFIADEEKAHRICARLNERKPLEPDLTEREAVEAR